MGLVYGCGAGLCVVIRLLCKLHGDKVAKDFENVFRNISFFLFSCTVGKVSVIRVQSTWTSIGRSGRIRSFFKVDRAKKNIDTHCKQRRRFCSVRTETVFFGSGQSSAADVPCNIVHCFELKIGNDFANLAVILEGNTNWKRNFSQK